jgi:hypothetical protein
MELIFLILEMFFGTLAVVGSYRLLYYHVMLLEKIEKNTRKNRGKRK